MNKGEASMYGEEKNAFLVWEHCSPKPVLHSG